MRALPALAAAVLVLAGSSGLKAAAATTVAAPTVKVVVRPVTSTGHVRAGFTVTGEPSGSVDCSFRDPSPGAVSPNIEFCAPSAEYAVACWKAAAPHRVLCMRDPRTKHVVRIPRSGAFAATGVAAARLRAPLGMRLRDGDYCSIRDGGAWGQLPGHPNLFGTYACRHDGAVWATANAAHQGVNESQPSWTVHTAHFGSSHLATRHVAKAWFVGTFTG
jgi:hypothetical protein